MTITTGEIDSQLDTWTTAAGMTEAATTALPPAGEAALFLGCGTSAFVAQAAAYLRQLAGLGPTDWAYASELPPDRKYPHVVAFTRSGTTTEVQQALTGPLAGARRVVVTAAPAELPDGQAEAVLSLPFADERSVVQTRFPTSVLVLMRETFGGSTATARDELRILLETPLSTELSAFDHFVYLGRGWTIALAHEAALKMREAAQAWSESFPALDYRHGPIAAAGSRTLVVPMSPLDSSLVGDVRATAATVLDLAVDPLVRLVQSQRLALALAGLRGLDPDNPRHLTRSVVLQPSALSVTPDLG